MSEGTRSDRAALNELLCETMASACNRGPGSVSLDTRMLELNMDSLTLVAVLARVEAVYELELEPNETLGLLEAASIAELSDRLRCIIEGRAVSGRSSPSAAGTFPR